MSFALDCHGLTVAVTGDWPEVLDNVRLDFAWFARAPAPARADVTVRVHRRAPDFDRFGAVPAAFVTPRNVVYQLGDRTVIDYFGRALAVRDETGALTIEGEEAHLVHEVAYLFLLSSIGAHLDAVGLPRLHALALSARSGAVAVMLPSGGGKSTLALRALDDPDVKLLSEDSPLIDARGRLHPFPLRIGINATDAERLPPEHVRRIERMEFHPKLALDLAGFEDRIETEPRPIRHLVVGRRSLGRDATLERLPRSAAAGALLREAVVGVGIYQGMEFVLQRGMRDTLAMGGVAAARTRSCAALLRRAEVWRLTVGRDHERNWQALRPLLT
ncbi:MAG TPA: hypothetical protein VF587_18500 [Solirubrobacteraceae bacterium]|jgi:hypothetical protein